MVRKPDPIVSAVEGSLVKATPNEMLTFVERLRERIVTDGNALTA
jgi:hypothetical protein